MLRHILQTLGTVMPQIVPRKMGPPDHLWQIMLLWMVPPDHLWRRKWSPLNYP